MAFCKKNRQRLWVLFFLAYNAVCFSVMYEVQEACNSCTKLPAVLINTIIEYLQNDTSPVMTILAPDKIWKVLYQDFRQECDGENKKIYAHSPLWLPEYVNLESWAAPLLWSTMSMGGEKGWLHCAQSDSSQITIEFPRHAEHRLSVIANSVYGYVSRTSPSILGYQQSTRFWLVKQSDFIEHLSSDFSQWLHIIERSKPSCIIPSDKGEGHVIDHIMSISFDGAWSVICTAWDGDLKIKSTDRLSVYYCGRDPRLKGIHYQVARGVIGSWPAISINGDVAWLKDQTVFVQKRQDGMSNPSISCLAQSLSSYVRWNTHGNIVCLKSAEGLRPAEKPGQMTLPGYPVVQICHATVQSGLKSVDHLGELALQVEHNSKEKNVEIELEISKHQKRMRWLKVGVSAGLGLVTFLAMKAYGNWRAKAAFAAAQR